MVATVGMDSPVRRASSRRDSGPSSLTRRNTSPRLCARTSSGSRQRRSIRCPPHGRVSPRQLRTDGSCVDTTCEHPQWPCGYGRISLEWVHEDPADLERRAADQLTPLADVRVFRLPEITCRTGTAMFL